MLIPTSSLDNLPLEWIRAFEAAGRTGSFSAAAQETGLTQSAISQRIGNLERRLGTQLFLRGARGVVLTVDGESWLPYVSSALRTLQQSSEQLFGMKRNQLVLSASATVIELWITQRLAELAAARQPLRVVLDSALQTPPRARVLAAGAPTLLCHAAGAEVPAGLAATAAQMLSLERVAGGLDLHQLMAELALRQCNEILVESGPRLAGAMLQQGLLDELIVYMAPALLGNRANPLLHLPLDQMADKVQLQVDDVRKIGQDWRFTVRPV